MTSSSLHSLSRASTPDWRGWAVAFCSGIGAGVFIGSEVSTMLHWQHPAGQITAGAVVAALTASLAKRPVVKTFFATILVAVSCLMTIIISAWLTGLWPPGHVDNKWPVVFAPWAFFGFWPAILISLIIAAGRRWLTRPIAVPNGSPAAPPPGNS